MIKFTEEVPDSYVKFEFSFNWKNPKLGFYVSLDMNKLSEGIISMLVNFLEDFQNTYVHLSHCVCV